MSRGAVFLDRDGTLNELVVDPISGTAESPLRVEDVRLIPGAAAAAHRLRAAGWALIGASNQPAAAKGTVPLRTLDAVQARVLELLSEAGVEFADFRICHHHPNGVVEGLAVACECRKPGPGMLLDGAAANGVDLGMSWTIGDTDGDVMAGRAAGTRTVLLENPASAHKRSGLAAPTATFADLASAASWLLSVGLVESPDGQ